MLERIRKRTKFCVKRVKWKGKKNKKSDQGTNPINFLDLACMKKAALKAKKKCERESECELHKSLCHLLGKG